MLAQLVAEFGAKVHACGSLVDLIERPGDYRLPCLTKNPSPVTAKHLDRDTWRWKEYRLKIFDFPGQTLYHNGLLVEKDGGWSAFFAGDSFTRTRPARMSSSALRREATPAAARNFWRRSSTPGPAKRRRRR